ncbi:MAG: Ig-like domain-containing protein [Bacteroidales bacterium]|nr:Ig-like domain-containing protein [Bacteroidales bacterium]
MQKRINTYIAIVLVIFISACATVVRPTGGPKDTTAPIALSYKPANGSVNFIDKKIVIKFDEYIVLEKLTQQLVVSPQMPEKPVVSISGKKLIVELPDSLKENTTYTIFFGDAVVNFKEKLPVHNFSYVFSTGNIVDSLIVEGTAVKAFDHSDYDELFIMLYKSKDDSVIYKEKPYYITKAQSRGNFFLHNLAPGEYQIYALKDANRNYIYDQEGEEIAFCKNLVIPYHPSEFIANDSVKPAKEKPEDLNLFVFEEWPKDIKFISRKIFPPHKVLFTFNKPIKDFNLIPLDFTPQANWHYDVYGNDGDSVTCFLLGIDKDSIDVIIADGDLHLDTLEIVLANKKKKSVNTGGGLFGRKKTKEDGKSTVVKKVIPKIDYSNNVTKAVHFFSELSFNFKVPLDNYKHERIELYQARDTLWIPVKIETRVVDKEKKQRISIKAKFQERKKYKLVVQDSTFFDLYLSTNDSLEKTFETTEMREYGSLDLNVKYSGESPLIIQLLNAKEDVLMENVIHESQIVKYPYMIPGKYKIKAIEDKNNNGKWDRGDLEKRILPERIYYINKIITIRANWDNEQIWTLETK